MSSVDNLLSTPDEIVPTNFFVRKNLYYFLTSFFSIYNYLFRFFLLYSVFNEHFVVTFLKKSNQKTLHYYLFNSVGGDDGFRTHDPLLAGQVLSQLSYTPKLNSEFRIRNSELFKVLLFLHFAFCILHFALRTSCAGRPKWTRTTDLVLIRHAL